MSFKYGILCIALFIMVLFLAIKSYDALTHPLNLTLDKGAAKKSLAKTENSPAVGVLKKPASTPPYNLIAEKNIFSPERKDFQGTGPGSASRSVIRPEVILYGITITGNYQSASLVNPGRLLKKGERDLMTLRLGERIGEYKLTKVLSDRITLEAQGDSFEVLLYDPKVPKKREGAPPAVPSPAFTPTGTPTPFTRREAAQGSKESTQEKTFPSEMHEPVVPSVSPLTTPGLTPTPTTGPTPTPIPGPTPTPTQIPPSMVPTPIVPPFTPTFAAPPPGMGGQSVPIPPGMGGQPVPIPPGMGGQSVPLPSGVPMQPSSSGGN